MNSRFEVREYSKDAYGVYDNDADSYGIPIKAVSIYMRKDAAEKICQIMNDEWIFFICNP